MPAGKRAALTIAMSDFTPPLFGLRWVPDAQLRPLRYLPPALPVPAAVAGDEDGVPTPLRMQQQVRSLQARLAAAEERVAQKSEQVRWLKEMTKLESRRHRVSRWMSGPLLRVFGGWRRVVREAKRKALAEAEAAAAEGSIHARQLQLECDELLAEHGTLSLSLEAHLRRATRDRTAAGLARLFRRWRSLRQVRGSSKVGVVK